MAHDDEMCECKKRIEDHTLEEYLLHDKDYGDDPEFREIVERIVSGTERSPSMRRMFARAGAKIR